MCVHHSGLPNALGCAGCAAAGGVVAGIAGEADSETLSGADSHCQKAALLNNKCPKSLPGSPTLLAALQAPQLKSAKPQLLVLLCFQPELALVPTHNSLLTR